MTRLRAAGQVGSAARHARQGRAHLSADAQHDDVALELRPSVSTTRWLGSLSSVVEVNLVGNRPDVVRAFRPAGPRRHAGIVSGMIGFRPPCLSHTFAQG